MRFRRTAETSSLTLARPSSQSFEVDEKGRRISHCELSDEWGVIEPINCMSLKLVAHTSDVRQSLEDFALFQLKCHTVRFARKQIQESFSDCMYVQK
jgi:hypothetical protein